MLTLLCYLYDTAQVYIWYIGHRLHGSGGAMQVHRLFRHFFRLRPARTQGVVCEQQSRHYTATRGACGTFPYMVGKVVPDVVQ